MWPLKTPVGANTCFCLQVVCLKGSSVPETSSAKMVSLSVFAAVCVKSCFSFPALPVSKSVLFLLKRG